MINFRNIIFAFGCLVGCTALLVGLLAANGTIKVSLIKDIWDVNFVLWGICLGGLLVATASRFIPEGKINFSGKIAILTGISGAVLLYLSLVEGWYYGYKDGELTNRGYLIALCLGIALVLWVVQKARGVKLVS
jgi:hypothetical protein